MGKFKAGQKKPELIGRGSLDEKINLDQLVFKIETDKATEISQEMLRAKV